jgi:hypothetical protein
VHGCGCFRGICLLSVQHKNTLKKEADGSRRSWYPSTKLHDVTSQRWNILIPIDGCVFHICNYPSNYRLNPWWTPWIGSPSLCCLPVHSRCRGCLFSLDHTQTHTTVGRTPLDEGSARRRDLYLTTQTLYKTNIHAPGGIRTHDPSKRSAAAPRLRLHGHVACSCVQMGG